MKGERSTSFLGFSKRLTGQEELTVSSPNSNPESLLAQETAPAPGRALCANSQMKKQPEGRETEAGRSREGSG